LLRFGAKIVPGGDDLFRLGFLLESIETDSYDRLHGDAVALRAHRKRSRIDARTIQRPATFASLLPFSLLIRNVGDDVARMSSEGTPGYPAPLTACMVTAITVSSVKRRCNGAGPSPVQWRAVGICDGKAAGFAPPGLGLDQLDMIAIDLWEVTAGTSACMRNRASNWTRPAQPAAATAARCSRRSRNPRAAKIIFGAPSGLAGRNCHLGNVAGMGVFKTPARSLA